MTIGCNLCAAYGVGVSFLSSTGDFDLAAIPNPLQITDSGGTRLLGREIGMGLVSQIEVK